MDAKARGATHPLKEVTMNRTLSLAMLLVTMGSAGCSSGISDEDGARLAYLGADTSVERALALGFAGFNAATSANIPQQQTAGAVSGLLTVTGQVDQGSSDNKGMRLLVSYASYADDPVEDTAIVYDSPAPLALDLSMKGLPNADLTGTMVGDLTLSGDLEGDVHFNLTFAGTTEADPNATGSVRRVVGSTHITGTATSEYGTYPVDVVR
jgi:hypothetical protein